MGKHEKAGLGRALVRHHNQMVLQSKEKGRFYMNQQKRVLESVTEVNDIDIVIEQAEEADRLYSVENPNPNLVINLDAEPNMTPEERMKQQKKEEALYASSLRVPRRPPSNTKMSVEDLDANERQTFLIWRRSLSSLEENEKLVLTPFEKNLDIWRQLWRVLERSDLLVMVVDARDPLFYHCPDLESTFSGSIIEMVGSDSPPGSPGEDPKPNSDANPPPKNDNSIEAVARRVQDSLSLGKKHKFWETQPVGQFKDLGDTSLPEGPIEDPTPLSEVKQEPYNLPGPYEWTTCDIDDDDTCTEVYNLLTNNYVEDDENMFRFNYSKEFLRWALRPPGYFRSWHIGVRVKASKKLVAFITGIPARIRVRDDVVLMAEINFLCVHKKLRSKRLAPVMIKEVTRRVHLENIWQAAYTAGVVIPTPVSTCQYWHRSLNPKKLIDVGFSRLGARMTMNRTIKLYKLPESTVTPGFRKMELRDVPAVNRLLRNYLSKFAVAPDFDENDVEHWLLPKEGVVDSYLVESPETHEITDFCSFYTLPSSILGNQNYTSLKAAYSYYNVSTQTPLHQLMNDALIVAKIKDYDVFNALDIMHNESFLKELKFGPGDGQLHYYLYNYRLKNALKPLELGLVLL